MLTERSIINSLIWIGALIAAPYLAVAALNGNFVPAFTLAAVCSLVVAFGILKDKMCLLPLFAAYIGGQLNFIPFRLSTTDAAALGLVIYYVVAYIALQRKIMKTGPMLFLIPIIVFVGIVFYHEHDLGLRVFGSGREGAKGALLIELSAVAYLCGVSVDSPSPSFFARVPFYCIFIALFSAIPYTITTYFPGLAPYFAMVTSNINATALATSADDDVIVRNSGAASVAASLMVYLLSFYPLHTWFQPHRLWMLLVGLASSWFVVMGGFRGALVTYVVTILIAAVCHYRWRALILLPPMVFALFLVTAVQDSHLMKIPASAQRTMDFLPGEWDPEVVNTTESSNDFRDKIQAVYLREELHKSPFFGNGFSYDSDEFEKMNYLSKTQETSDGYYATKIFVVGKIFHIGWISLYDSVGLVGGAAFLFFAGSMIWVIAIDVFGTPVDQRSTFWNLKIWMICNLFPSIFGYFTVFGDIKGTFPIFLYYAILWTHVKRLERLGHVAQGTPIPRFTFDPAKGTSVSAYHS